jgi:hypothetical protein
VTDRGSLDDESPTALRSARGRASVLRSDLLNLNNDSFALVDKQGGRGVSTRILALIADSASLLQGISSGLITVGQPRIATNLLAVVEELQGMGHDEFATSFVDILGDLSSTGIAAEHCVLDRDRLPQRKRQ